MRFSVKYSHSRGFSLLEVLIATFIFSIIMIAVTSYFVSVTSANQNSKRLQQNLEDVRFVMNRIAKVFRTSVLISSTTTEVRVFDYSQKRCLRYRFEGNSIVEYSSVSLPTGQLDEKGWCAGMLSFSSNTLMSVSTGVSLSGRFVAVPSDDGATGGSKLAGRVTMNATVTRQNNASTIQTTVSLRNYKEVYHP